jgi:hypothetical protein
VAPSFRPPSARKNARPGGEHCPQIREKPLGFASALNHHRYANKNPFTATDPSGTDWLDNTGNFAAGWGDALTMGGTRWIRKLLGVDGIVDDGSGS